MKSIIKRDGTRQKFDKNKIIDAVLAAFKEVDGDVTDYALEKSGNIADYIADVAEERELSIEEIQDYVEKGLMATRRKDVARAYILYREKRTQARKNPLDSPALELISGTNEELNYENSNKRSELVTTQRDYLAGILSKHIAKKYIFPHDAIEAHEEGIIHIHDMDYMAQNTLSNCCLINLNDMLQNGTVINGVLIEKPHRIITAMTIATQIVSAVASSQYGKN
jgi:ribonucleoside-triphosphate reductase (formate)